MSGNKRSSQVLSAGRGHKNVVPDSNAAGDPLVELANPTNEFGREFRILSFRWLNDDEI